MIRYVALLRGINVGGKRKVPMSELRLVFESQGFADVGTYIQSGNVLFKADGRVSTVNLESAIADRFGIDVDVILRTSTDLHRIVTESPLAARDPKLVHLGFMAKAPDPTSLQHLDLGGYAPETAEVRGSEVYFYLPNGMSRTKLPAYVDRHLQVPTTIRNWATTTKLLELTSS